jgi:hypothetical protein
LIYCLYVEDEVEVEKNRDAIGGMSRPGKGCSVRHVWMDSMLRVHGVTSQKSKL